MAENIREIKKRIQSVEKTKKITQAMKMVSAAKFKRNVKALDLIKQYGSGIDAIMASLGESLFDDDISELMIENPSPQVAMVVMSSDRGLCGGFNANLFRKVSSEISNHQQVDLYLLGNKSLQYFKSKNVNVIDSKPSFKSNNNDNDDVSQYINVLIEGYKKGVYSKVIIIYNEFVSALSSNIIAKQLLPVSVDNWDRATTTTSDFIYEPSKGVALTEFCSVYINYLFNRAIKESAASEEGFRMAAMDSASNNAREMIQELTLFYNRSRQAAITTELTEIVAGAALIS